MVDVGGKALRFLATSGRSSMQKTLAIDHLIDPRPVTWLRLRLDPIAHGRKLRPRFIFKRTPHDAAQFDTARGQKQKRWAAIFDDPKNFSGIQFKLRL